MKLSIDSKVSYLATFIAVLALFFSILDHYQNRKHNKKTVAPILLVEVQEAASKYGIFLSNQGYGPAIIDSCIVYYENARVQGKDTWSEVFIMHYSTPIDFDIEYKTLNNSTVIKSGESRLLWGASTKDLQGNIQFLNNSIGKISLKIYYSSIYKDKLFAEFH